MNRPLVLACEDETRIVELIRTLTEPLGVELVAAEDGAAALAFLSTRRPALMTLDLVLPNLDGFALLEKMRQMRGLEDVPVVVISAMTDAQTIKRIYQLGAVDFIPKPFNVDMLDAKLRVFLRMRGLAEAVKQRQAFLEEVVEQLSSGLIVVDGAGVIVRINAAGCSSVSRRADELVGRRVADALPGAEPMFLVAGERYQQRVTIKTPHGERVLGFTNSTVEVNGTQGAVAVFRELSDVEAAQRERAERVWREQLASSARSFVHEVRNPLSAISAAGQMIARSNIPDEQRTRLARAIEGEANRIAGLMQEYVERREAPTAANAVDVYALLSEVVEVNLLDSPARARIGIDCDHTIPAVRADGARLKQVVLNLVLNAIKATAENDTIRLIALREENGVALKVADTGCGIPAEVLPQIFDETYSTRQGGGLGLSIARRIVQAHGGEIRVESVEGKGTTFTVWLPILGGHSPA